MLPHIPVNKTNCHIPETETLKVIVYSPYRTVAPHFETELEIIQRHLDLKDEVEYLVCRGELPNCEFNASHVPANCENCTGRRDHGLEMINGNLRLGEIPFSGSSMPDWPEFQSIDQLKQFHRDGFDLGYAVTSSIVSMVRDPQPDMRQLQPIIRRFLDSAWQTWLHARERLATTRPDLVYVFNGRFAAMRAVFRACQQSGIPCAIHERGCDTWHYQTFPDHLPHDIEFMHRRMKMHWQSADDHAARERIASEWFSNRRNRVEKNWISFVKGQAGGSLPDDWNHDQRNLVIFSSSEDEFVGISDSWKSRLYTSQNDGISQLANDLNKANPSIRIWLRMHPNQANSNNSLTRAMRSLNFPNLEVLPPESSVDSYALLDAAEKVITFGSSIGIESVWWKKPSVLLGPCYYQDLAGPYAAQSHQQAIGLCSSRLAPGPRDDAAMYGYWFQTNGIRFRHFEPEGFFHGKFKGQVLYARPHRNNTWEKIANHARRLIGFDIQPNQGSITGSTESLTNQGD